MLLNIDHIKTCSYQSIKGTKMPMVHDEFTLMPIFANLTISRWLDGFDLQCGWVDLVERAGPQVHHG